MAKQGLNWWTDPSAWMSGMELLKGAEDLIFCWDAFWESWSILGLFVQSRCVHSSLPHPVNLENSYPPVKDRIWDPAFVMKVPLTIPTSMCGHFPYALISILSVLNSWLLTISLAGSRITSNFELPLFSPRFFFVSILSKWIILPRIYSLRIIQKIK